MEQQRGISISAAALEFEWEGRHVTLLDTPGHQDFSADTYRTLLAVDSVVMVLDAAKGVEPQTIKLFEVCRMRGLPVLTFINKLDQPRATRSSCSTRWSACSASPRRPSTGRIGDGVDFRGVFDLEASTVLLYERGERGRRTEPSPWPTRATPPCARWSARRGSGAHRRRRDHRRGRHALRRRRLPRGHADAGLLRQRAERFRRRALPPCAAGARTEPGAALERRRCRPARARRLLGVRVQGAGEHEPAAPGSRGVPARLLRAPHEGHDGAARASGHRRFASRVYRFFGRDRETIPEAYPGDVVGLVVPGRLAIGDTLYSGRRVRFPPVPQFAAEHFAFLRPADVRHKRFDEAVQQLEEEGLIQTFHPRHGPRHPIVGVVGPLQLDVVQARMKTEYAIACIVEPLPHVAVRWPVPLTPDAPPLWLPVNGVMPVVDHQSARRCSSRARSSCATRASGTRRSSSRRRRRAGSGLGAGLRADAAVSLSTPAQSRWPGPEPVSLNLGPKPVACARR
jgi:peptide chain release factor 3